MQTKYKLVDSSFPGKEVSEWYIFLFPSIIVLVTLSLINFYSPPNWKTPLVFLVLGFVLFDASYCFTRTLYSDWVSKKHIVGFVLMSETSIEVHQNDRELIIDNPSIRGMNLNSNYIRGKKYKRGMRHNGLCTLVINPLETDEKVLKILIENDTQYEVLKSFLKILYKEKINIKETIF
ncbi:hypothetical protein [Chondrinema litorale]|uniref:hypothetical protein n=1 Tax=Chondrinema litorale TaxID=2994555 RepID=UPI002542EB53|nr:hypothetical protein [Chondrinema litorale]UZR97273.1 hypothetical protein OQ292_25570 [Chondrinema litorale]